MTAIETATTKSKPRARVGFIRCAILATFVLLLVISLVAAPKENSAWAKKGDLVYAELAKAPRKAVARRNPFENDPDAAVAGGKLFEMHCAECHGDMAEGGRKAPSLLADPVQQAKPGALFWILTNGVVRRGMPVWSKLPEPERWQIVSYLKALVPGTPEGDEGKSPGSAGQNPIPPRTSGLPTPH